MVDSNYKIGFFGTGPLAITVLETLSRDYKILPALIVTQPDKEAGRGLTLTKGAVKIFAEEKNIPLLQPATLKDADIAEKLSGFGCDIFLVVSYGKIIPENIIESPRYKTVNLHPSVLPKYRGPSPVQATILSNDTDCGITLMLIDKEVDHGPILAQDVFPFEATETTSVALQAMLGTIGARLVADALPLYIEGSLKPHEQEHEKATYTRKIEKEEGEIFLDSDPKKNILKFNAHYGWPGTYFFYSHKNKPIRVLVTDASYEEGRFILKNVKPEGKKEMSFEEFVRGYGDPVVI